MLFLKHAIHSLNDEACPLTKDGGAMEEDLIFHGLRVSKVKNCSVTFMQALCGTRNCSTHSPMIGFVPPDDKCCKCKVSLHLS